MNEKKSFKSYKTFIILAFLLVALSILIYNFLTTNKITEFKYKRNFGKFQFESIIKGNLWKNEMTEIENIVYFPYDDKPSEETKQSIIKTQEKLDSDIRSIKGINYKVEFIPGKIKKSYSIPLDSQENIKKCVEIGILDAERDAKSINLKKTLKSMDEDEEWEKVKN